MRFSSKERYGLRFMVELARRYGQGPVSLAQAAEAEGLPEAYLEQIAISLRGAGLISSARGAHGGYTLARPPTEINVGDVIRALEGAIVTIPCVAEEVGVPCGREDICAARNVWQVVSHRLGDTLDAITLASLLEPEVA